MKMKWTEQPGTPGTCFCACPTVVSAEQQMGSVPVQAGACVLQKRDGALASPLIASAELPLPQSPLEDDQT